MIVSVDFDGTCVTHEFPNTGKDIGAEIVLKALKEAGHDIIAMTMRSGEQKNIFGIDTIEELKKWFKSKEIELYGINENPDQANWSKSRKIYANIYIDDQFLGCPLVFSIKLSGRPFVNWAMVTEMLYSRCFLTEKLRDNVLTELGEKYPEIYKSTLETLKAKKKMITRNDVLSKAADDCMKELYRNVQPEVEWDDFVHQCKEYNKKYKEWESIKENRPDIHEFCGPRPYEYYYIPKDVMKSICDSYIHAYRIDQHQELIDTIEILKNYCEKPIVDKYVEEYTDETGFHHPGYRDYDHPKSLPTVLGEMLDDADKGNEAWDKMKEFLDMAGNFFSWNSDLNSFSMTVYLGASPTSNKEAVIENWKKYMDVDIVIDDKKFYGDEEEWLDNDIYNNEES